MEKIVYHLKEMEKWLDQIAVKKENVDFMAMARQEYRNVMTEIERIKKEEKNGRQDDWGTEKSDKP